MRLCAIPSRRRFASPCRWGEEKIGDLIGENTVDFLRHRAVERPQAGLDVADRMCSLGPDERRGDRGVHIAVTSTRSGRRSSATLEARHDLAGLRGVGRGADFERRREPAARAAQRRHPTSARRMLSGVDDRLLDRRNTADRMEHGGGFMKFGRAPTTWMRRIIRWKAARPA